MQSAEVEERYLYVNKRYGTITGVWPFGNDRLKWVGRITMIVISLMAITTQLSRVVFYLSVDTIIEQCPFLVIGLGMLLKECNYIIHEKQLKMIFECVFEDWSMQRPKDETDILDKYAKRGLLFSKLYVINGCLCFVIFTLVAITPRVLDIISPKNVSRGVELIYPAYYGFDEEEHYWIIMAHMLVCTTVIFFVYISCDSIYMTIVQHACGLLNLCGYRFRCAIEDSVSNNNWKGNTKIMHHMYLRVFHSIKAHQHAMDYVMKIEHIHETYLFLVVALVMVSFSITLVKTSLMKPCLELYKYCCFLVVQLVHLFFLAVQGHFIIVSNETVYDNIYEGLWYATSPKIQALYLFALRRNLTPPLLSAGGLMTLNLKSFSEIVKGSVSYFTVLKSA